MQEFEKEWENTEYSLKLDLVQEYMDQPGIETNTLKFKLSHHCLRYVCIACFLNFNLNKLSYSSFIGGHSQFTTVPLNLYLINNI